MRLSKGPQKPPVPPRTNPLTSHPASTSTQTSKHVSPKQTGYSTKAQKPSASQRWEAQHHHPNRQAGVHNADTTASWGAHATNADTTTAQAFSHQPTTTTATRTDNSMTDTLRARVLVFRVVSCRSAPPLTGLRPFSQGGVGTGVRVLMRGLGRNVGRNVGRADHTYL